MSSIITNKAQTLYNEATAIADLLEEARTRTVELSAGADEVLRANPLPVTFTGVVQDYRYTTRDFNGAFTSPMHKLFVECGAGLWLYSQNTSAQFENVVAGMEMPEVSNMRSLLVGKVVRVARVGNDLLLSAVVADGPFEVRDSRGQFLYTGANVLHPNRPGTLLREDGNPNGDLVVLTDQGEFFVRADAVVRVD